MKKNILITLLFALTGKWSTAQEVSMADTFREEGKIYVVVAVALIVLLGIVLYLVSLDRRLRQLERKNKTGK